VAGFPGLGVLRRLRPVPARSADRGPARPARWLRAKPGEDRDGSRVHSLIDQRGRQPTLPLWPRREYAAGFPHGLLDDRNWRPGSSPPRNGRTDARHLRPASARFRAGGNLRGFTTPVSRVCLSASLAAPTSSGSA